MAMCDIIIPWVYFPRRTERGQNLNTWFAIVMITKKEFIGWYDELYEYASWFLGNCLTTILPTVKWSVILIETNEIRNTLKIEQIRIVSLCIRMFSSKLSLFKKIVPSCKTSILQGPVLIQPPWVNDRYNQ